MAESTSTSIPKVDINTIPYTAPLTIQDPPSKWKNYQNFKGLNCRRVSVPAANLRGKWIIISGANNGIGREAALQMAAWGANLILACRDPPAKELHPTVAVSDCKAAARSAGHEKSVIEWWELDCAKLESVESFAKRWLDTGRALDVLCNNAGIGDSPGGTKVFRTQDGFEILHQVNFLSHILLTLRLLPSLGRAPAPRIVCTSSSFHYIGMFNLADFNGELCQTVDVSNQYYKNNKLYLQVWLAELQRRMLLHDQYRHITINGVHPGYVNTGIWNLNSKGWLFVVLMAFLKLAARFMAISAQQGSLAILNGVTSPEAGPDPEVQGVGEKGGKGGGRYFNRIWEEPPMPHTKDADCRMRVWRKVNDELKLQEKGLLDVLGLYFD